MKPTSLIPLPLTLLCALLSTAAFAQPAVPPAVIAPASPAASPTPVIRVACVGDSITYGSGTSNPKTQSYPAQLSRLLGSGYLVGDYGVGGATLMDAGDKPYRRQKAFTQALSFHPDIVVILLGTNDSKPQNWKGKDRFVGDYESLIEQFTHAEPKPKVLVGYPVLVVGAGNFGINEPGVEEAMKMVDRIAADEKATVIDLHATLTGKAALIPDRVHPNDEGAGLMAKTVYKALIGQEFVGPVPPLAPPVTPPAVTPPPVVAPAAPPAAVPDRSLKTFQFGRFPERERRIAFLFQHDGRPRRAGHQVGARQRRKHDFEAVTEGACRRVALLQRRQRQVFERNTAAVILDPDLDHRIACVDAPDTAAAMHDGVHRRLARADFQILTALHGKTDLRDAFADLLPQKNAASVR